MALHADPRMCALNPRTFCEKKYTAARAARPKKIAVIGDAARVGNLRSVIWSANDLVLTL